MIFESVGPKMPAFYDKLAIYLSAKMPQLTVRKAA
jgi:hypothetical protein